MNAEQSPDMELKILEAAKVVFVRKGYETTKMTDIAAEAGIGRTALHYYFRTKEMLFDAIFGQVIAEVVPNIEPIVNMVCPFLDKMEQIIPIYSETIIRNPLLPIFVASEMTRDVDHLIQTLSKNTSRLLPILKIKEQLQEEMDNGTLRKLPLIDVVSTLVSLIVFPMLTRNMLTPLFLDGDKEAFAEYYLRRRKLIAEIMRNLLTPEIHRGISIFS